MDETSSRSQDPIQIEITEIGDGDFSVVPGDSLTISVQLLNQGSKACEVELSVRGIPRQWVYLSVPAVRLVPGSQREVSLMIQPPGGPYAQAGRYSLVVQAISSVDPDCTAEAHATLTVAALAVEGRIGVLTAATEFSVEPGRSITVPLVLINRGLEEDTFDLSVEDIPDIWTTISPRSIRLAPGQQRELSVDIHPPRQLSSRAGHWPFKIQVRSQAVSDQIAQAQCTLIVDSFDAFDATLAPEQMKAGQVGQIIVENQGNVAQTFQVAWQSRENELAFLPTLEQESGMASEPDAAAASDILTEPPATDGSVAALQIQVPSGEAGTVAFHAAPRRRHLFGKERAYPFLTRVWSGDGSHQMVRGQVLGPPLIPMGVGVGMFVGLLGAIALLIGIVLASNPAPPAQATAPAGDDTWARVQSAGKLVVGTAADYPPFEYYNQDFRLDGFDIALIGQIAGRLGLAVEFRDLAFEGLPGALQLNQIDLAIAALSITPEREGKLDFSNIYYVGKDGVLAREGSGINAIGSVGEMAPFRVGVQRGTVYQDWLTSNLVDPGAMPAGNLFVYDKGEHAVRDLRDNRLDLVVADLLPAQLAAAQGGVRLVGQNLNTQYFGMAMRNGAASLKQQVDRALSELQNEGVVGRLAQEYLQINPEDLPPLPTSAPIPTPTAGPAPTPGCVDGMTLVEHLSFDDGGMTNPPELAPGAPFTKGWRVRNNGTCVWDTTYRLVYVEGNHPAAQMGGQPLTVTRLVPPGETFDLQVNLVAPLQAGTYQGIWQMVNREGVAFGQRIWVGIRVLAQPTPTPLPTQPPAPGISFAVDRSQIKAGECVNFRWGVDIVKAVYFHAEGEPWEQNGVPGQGARTVCPPSTVTYYLRVVKPDNAVDVRQITILVEPSTQTPQIVRFTVDPPYQSIAGQPLTIQWAVEGTVSRVRIQRNGQDLWGDAPWSGRLIDADASVGQMNYTIEASGPGGTGRQQRTVSVVETPSAATPTPARPPSGPSAPAIYAFSVSPGVVEVGQCLRLVWNTGGGTTSVDLIRNGAIILSTRDLEGSAQDCQLKLGTSVYRIEARNGAGEATAQEASVVVNAPGAGNPLAGTRWQVTGYTDGTGVTRPILGGMLLTLEFGADGSLNGSAGCNTFSTFYLVQEATMQIGAPNITQSTCNTPEGIMQQENAFLSAIRSVATYEIQGAELALRAGSGTVVVSARRP